jgi:hypothetical protein
MGSLAPVQRTQHSCICLKVPQPIKFLDAALHIKLHFIVTQIRVLRGKFSHRVWHTHGCEKHKYISGYPVEKCGPPL